MREYMSPEYAEYQAKRSRAERARERAARMIGVTDLSPAPELEDLIDDAEEMCARVGATLDAPAFALYDYWLRRRATALGNTLNRMVQPQHRALVSLVADAVIVDVYRQSDNHLWFHQFERRALWGNPRDLALDIVAMMERKEA